LVPQFFPHLTNRGIVGGSGGSCAATSGSRAQGASKIDILNEGI